MCWLWPGTGREAEAGAGSAPQLRTRGRLTHMWAFCSTIIKNFKTLTASVNQVQARSSRSSRGKLAPGPRGLSLNSAQKMLSEMKPSLTLTVQHPRTADCLRLRGQENEWR